MTMIAQTIPLVKACLVHGQTAALTKDYTCLDLESHLVTCHALITDHDQN
jgi:hypothetical protein